MQALCSIAQADAPKASGALNSDGWTDLKLVAKKQLTHNTFALRWVMLLRLPHAHLSAQHIHTVIVGTVERAAGCRCLGNHGGVTCSCAATASVVCAVHLDLK